MLISDRIFRLLKEKKITQKELSKRTGIAEGTISDWKRKGLNPSADRIVSIAEALEVDPLMLLGVKTSSDGTFIIEKKEAEADKILLGEEIRLIELYRAMPEDKKKKLMGYASFFAQSAAFSEE